MSEQLAVVISEGALGPQGPQGPPVALATEQEVWDRVEAGKAPSVASLAGALPFKWYGTLAAPRYLVFHPTGDDPQVDTSDPVGRNFRPKVAVISYGDGLEVPSKSWVHGCLFIDEINDTPELIGHRSEGQFVDGGIYASSTTTATFTDGVSTVLNVAQLWPGTVTWRNTGTVIVQDPGGSGNAVYTWTTIDRVAGTIGGLTKIRGNGQTVFPVGSIVTSLILNNTNLLMFYGQAWMGKGGYQDRSAQIAVFTAETHSPDGFGGYYSAGKLQITCSSPGPNSQRVAQWMFRENGNLGAFGSWGMDEASMDRRLTVSAASSRATVAFTLPIASIPIDNPSGFPTAGEVVVASSTGTQTVAYTGKAAIDGFWYLTGCTGGTGNVNLAANIQIAKTSVGTVIGAHGDICAWDDGSVDAFTIGLVGPNKEGGFRISDGSGVVLFYRGAPGELWSESTLWMRKGSGSTDAIRLGVIGETEPRVALRPANVAFGIGGVTPLEAILRRTNTLELGVRNLADSADGDFKMARARITGALTHTGTQAGFFGVTVVNRPAAYTQTYATATRTHAARTAATLVDSSGGTSGVTAIAAIPNPADTPATADALRDDLVANTIPAIKNAVATLAAMVNKVMADQVNTAQVLNQSIDDDQIIGLKQ